ncbi:MAG: LysR family transcriptional regulator, partial [Peptococcaceae bacterium]|nr:LysR family transcriptional regulator [Peptococcaceae bacterium]
MRFEQLECLLAVEETGSFVGAAQKLFLTQQAISMSMKQLEQELGQPLLVRENKKIIFTPFGEEVLAFSRKMLNDRDEFLRKAHTKSQETEVLHINICSNSCVANMTLPEIVYNMEAQKRKAAFKISQAESLDSILRHVQSGKKDVGLVSMNSEELDRKFAAYENELQLEILAQDELVAVLNRKDYDGKHVFIPVSEQMGRYFTTMYYIEPIDEYKFSVDSTSLTCSNDADFHRAMLEKGGTMVLMSGLSYQYFFKDKK